MCPSRDDRLFASSEREGGKKNETYMTGTYVYIALQQCK